MAKKATERVYTIPLRKEWVKQSRIRRVPRTVRVIREFLKRHTKAEEVKLSTGLNEFLWLHGAKKPPGKVKVKVSVEEGKAFARLPEEEKVEKIAKKGKKEPAKEEPKKAEEKKEEAKKEAPEKEEKGERKEEKPKEEKELTPSEKEAEKIWKEAEEKVKGESNKKQ